MSTPNVGRVRIATTTAQVKSDGTSAGTGTDLMALAFTAGANGSYVDRVRFFCVANAATNSIATTLRVYLSTIASPGATTTSDTYLLGEVGVPIVAAASLTVAAPYYDIILGISIPSGTYLLVSQATAQTTNQAWNACVFGTNY